MVACKVINCPYNEKTMCGKKFLRINEDGTCGYLYDKYGKPGVFYDNKKEITVLETEYIEEEDA